MKILSAEQTREADQYTIENEPIASIDLMERAALQATGALLQIFPESAFAVFCGMGNNGGDGLAMARMLKERGREVIIYIVQHKDQGSEDFETNYSWNEYAGVTLRHLEKIEDIDESQLADKVIVDAILGSGLNSPLRGFIADVVAYLNGVKQPKVAVDIPTGLFADDNRENDLKLPFRADYTLTFQHPKSSFLHAFTAPFAGDFRVLDIGLLPEFYERASSHDFYLTPGEVLESYKPRSPFAHKGKLGHAYLIAGSRNKAGAAILAAEAASRGGCGLVTANVPETVIPSLNIRCPEVMAHPRDVALRDVLPQFRAVGCGPGLGTDQNATELVKQLLGEAGQPLVLDADALNIIAENKTWLAMATAPKVLTPHPGEWQRLCEEEMDWDYPERLSDFARRYQCYIVLKDARSTIATPGGKQFYCNFGTAALATGGSGDVLTGLLTSLLAQGYEMLEAIALSLYYHGRAAHWCESQYRQEAITARELIKGLTEK